MIDPTTPTDTDGARPGRSVALAVTGLAFAGVVAFGGIAPPERCPQPTIASIDESTESAVRWFVRNQRADGTWLYEYDVTNDEDRGGYNAIRHAGAIMGLYQSAAAGLPDALESADRGLEWARANFIEHDDWTAVAYQGRAATGTVALLVAGLVDRHLYTGDTAHDALLHSLGRFLVAQTTAEGAVIAQFDAVAMRPQTETRSKYYTGEAYWALARLHRLFPDAGYGEVADRIGNYLATLRDEVEDEEWPPLPDHWFAYGLAETVEFPERDPERPLTEAELTYARRQAGLFAGQVRWVSQQAGPWGRVVRGGHVVRGGGYGVVGEALSGLWRVAEADARLADLRAPIAERTECIVGLAQEVQTRDPSNPRADGAWFVRGLTRMDDQQHAISAQLRTTAIVQAEAADEPGHDAPSGWLWAIALFATFNPIFVSLAMPRRERAQDRAALAALGGLIGSVIVVVVAFLSGPLLDLLDVSRPAVRIAVGVVGAAAGIVRMIGRLPTTQPATKGLAAAVVPVAIPYVATPALILLGLSAGADLGVAVVALTMAVAIAVLVAKVGWLEGGDTAHVLYRWVARLLGVCAVAACVLLVIDGVFDV
jgi:small neutral amino acid transporter SnatA (MarC family)